jgi:hypothetical protein
VKDRLDWRPWQVLQTRPAASETLSAGLRPGPLVLNRLILPVPLVVASAQGATNLLRSALDGTPRAAVRFVIARVLDTVRVLVEVGEVVDRSPSAAVLFVGEDARDVARNDLMEPRLSLRRDGNYEELETVLVNGLW